MSGMNIVNMNEEFDRYSVDHGFDPPTKMDSGRGAGSYASGYGGRGANEHSLPRNHMFDIEEDNEDQFDQHYQ